MPRVCPQNHSCDQDGLYGYIYELRPWPGGGGAFLMAFVVLCGCACVGTCTYLFTAKHAGYE